MLELRVKGLFFKYDVTDALRDVDLEVNEEKWKREEKWNAYILMMIGEAYYISHFQR